MGCCHCNCSNPPQFGAGDYVHRSDFRCKATSQGFGGGQQFSITPQMGIDIQNLLSALSSFVKDGRVSLSVEVEAFDVLSDSAVIDGSVKGPAKFMNFKFRIGNGFSDVRCEKQNDSHGLNVPNAMHGDRDGQGPNEIIGSEAVIIKPTAAGDVNV